MRRPHTANVVNQDVGILSIITRIPLFGWSIKAVADRSLYKSACLYLKIVFTIVLTSVNNNKNTSSSPILLLVGICCEFK